MSNYKTNTSKPTSSSKPDNISRKRKFLVCKIYRDDILDVPEVTRKKRKIFRNGIENIVDRETEYDEYESSDPESDISDEYYETDDSSSSFEESEVQPKES